VPVDHTTTSASITLIARNHGAIDAAATSIGTRIRVKRWSRSGVEAASLGRPEPILEFVEAEQLVLRKSKEMCARR